ncbi:peptidase S8/S53 domain-containing protein [Syncephalis plumigaleata]|nr:peptidase S8/S53 domain-containing protein [Syncephalis plumigaleata]
MFTVYPLWSGCTTFAMHEPLNKRTLSRSISLPGRRLSTTLTHDMPREFDLRIVNPHKATGVATLHAQGYYGYGIKIGILDTGIDYTHPALGGCFGPGCKVAYGYDFVGSKYDGSDKLQPDDNPKEELKGVARDALLGAYRVVGCGDEAPSFLVKDAIRMAVDHGMNIINLSMSHLIKQSNEYEITDALNEAANAGVIVVASAGNNIDHTMWQARDPASLPSVISVGTAQVPGKLTAWFQLMDKLPVDIAYSTPCQNAMPLTRMYPLVAISVKHSGHLTTDIRTIGECDLEQLLELAKKRGAIGVITRTSVDYDGTCHVPLFVVSSAYGQLMATKLANSICAHHTSNWGPAPWLTPPLISVLTTSTLFGQLYRRVEGTSMATPYVSGAIALYLNFHKPKQIDLTAIRAAFQNTATPVVSEGQSDIGSIAHQGDTKSRKSDFFGYTTHTITITNNDDKPVTYSLSHEPAATICNIKLCRRRIYAPLHISNTPIEPPDLLYEENWVYSGYIIADPSSPKPGVVSPNALRTFYYGLKGDRKNVMVPTCANVRQ